MAKVKIKALKRAYKETENSEDIFFPNKRDFHFWFAFINSSMFDDCLKKPQIIFARLHRKWGDAQGLIETGRSIIRLNNRFTEHKTRRSAASSRQMFINTLAHEMVHALEFQQCGDMSHGKFYREWKKKFSKIGITL